MDVQETSYDLVCFTGNNNQSVAGFKNAISAANANHILTCRKQPYPPLIFTWVIIVIPVILKNKKIFYYKFLKSLTCTLHVVTVVNTAHKSIPDKKLLL